MPCLVTASGAWKQARAQTLRLALLEAVAAGSVDGQGRVERIERLIAHVCQVALVGESLEQVGALRWRESVRKPQSTRVLTLRFAVRARSRRLRRRGGGKPQDCCRVASGFRVMREAREIRSPAGELDQRAAVKPDPSIWWE